MTPKMVLCNATKTGVNSSMDKNFVAIAILAYIRL